MLYLSNQSKYISMILMLSLLSCFAPARKSVAPDQFNLNPERAINIDWNKHKVKPVALDGKEISGKLKGWTETGFLIENRNEIDTLEYDMLRPYILVHSGQSNKGKGAVTGLAVGAGLSLVNLALVAANSNGSSKSDQPDPEPLADDVLGVSPGPYLVISTPLILAASFGIGSVIGSLSDKYERYYYDRDKFAAEPKMINDDSKNLILDDDFN